MSEVNDKRSEYAEAVNALVRQIPIGRVMTYGLIAEILREEMGIGGPRVVGNVLAGAGDRYAVAFIPSVEIPAVERSRDISREAEIKGTTSNRRHQAAVIGPAQDNFDLPWWRVVNVAGSPPPHFLTAALAALEREGTPMKHNGTQVDVPKAVWFPGIDGK